MCNCLQIMYWVQVCVRVNKRVNAYICTVCMRA